MEHSHRIRIRLDKEAAQANIWHISRGRGRSRSRSRRRRQRYLSNAFASRSTRVLEYECAALRCDGDGARTLVSRHHLRLCARALKTARRAAASDALLILLLLLLLLSSGAPPRSPSRTLPSRPAPRAVPCRPRPERCTGCARERTRPDRSPSPPTPLHICTPLASAPTDH